MISFFLHDFIVFYEAYVKMLWNIVKLGKMLFLFFPVAECFAWKVETELKVEHFPPPLLQVRFAYSAINLMYDDFSYLKLFYHF